MKRITFAYVDMNYEFDTYDEAKAYIVENRRKHPVWYFYGPNEWVRTDEPYKGYGDDDPRWCIAVKKPYKDGINPGW